MTDFLGRRRESVRLGDLPDDLRPGDIWKYINADGTPVEAAKIYRDRDMSGNLTGGVWGYVPPDDNGVGTLALHTVRENEDGTVSVLPGDGSSNSVLHSGGPEDKVWHGYIYNNVWRSC